MIIEQPGKKSYLTKIRNVALLPQERVDNVFSPEKGLVKEPWGEGQLLVTTDERIISFSQSQGSQETYIVPVGELQGIVVRSCGTRSSTSLLQGLLLVGGAFGLYVVLSYWLTGRFRGPNIPLVNVDVAPLVILMTILLGGWLLMRYYLAPSHGSATFRGANWSFAFPFTQSVAEDDIYKLVNATFIKRRDARASVEHGERKVGEQNAGQHPRTRDG